MTEKVPQLWVFGLGFIMLVYGLFNSDFLFSIGGFTLLGIGSLGRLMAEKGDERSICSALRLIAYPLSVVYVFVLNEIVKTFVNLPDHLSAFPYVFYFLILFAADKVYSKEEKRTEVAIAIWKSFRLAAILTAIFTIALAAISTSL